MEQNDAIKLLKGPYGREMANIACSYTSAIYWISPKKQKLNNGSIFFLNFGKGPFAVTADHVYQGFLDSKADDPATKCQIGNVIFAPHDRLIDRDSHMDIATFSVESKEIEIDNKTVHMVDTNNWPPKPPEVGKGLFFAGYPGGYRTAEIKKGIEVNFGSYFCTLVATRVKKNDIICQYERDEIINIFGDSELPYPQNLGGLSGAPLWTQVQTKIFSWRLAGIIYEFSPAFELLYARRPDCLLADGRIKRGSVT